MSSTIEQFVTEKKSNFAAFMEKMFEGNEAGGEIQSQIRMIRDMSAADFLVYCRAYLAPHKENNFDSFIGGLCAAHSQDISKFDPADVAKCRRYLELFCECCDQN